MLAATQPRAGTALLTKRGTPLGNAWLAAHLEKKLHKGQIIKTDVHGTVAEVIEMENGQLALRISGHLLLGVVRIFSRQVDYLLDDAKEAVIRVRLAFKPTTVDMAQDASTANRRFDELTLPAN
ncbi:Rad21/Rec8-like protein, partial [Pavlovales sp. CCMP2436]